MGKWVLCTQLNYAHPKPTESKIYQNTPVNLKMGNKWVNGFYVPNPIMPILNPLNLKKTFFFFLVFLKSQLWVVVVFVVVFVVVVFFFFFFFILFFLNQSCGW